MTEAEELELLDLEEEELLLEKEKLSLKKAPTRAESTAMGILQSGSFGFAEEIQAAIESGAFSGQEYEGRRDELRAEYKRGEEANPGFYNLGDYGTSIGGALVTGGASIPLALAGKMGVKTAAKIAAPGTLRKATALSAAGGAVEGAGRGEGNMYEDALLGGTIGAVAPGAFKLGGGLLKGTAKLANKAIPRPGRSGPISGRMSDIAASGAGVMGASPQVAKSYRKLLKDPEKLKAATEASDKFSEDFPKFREEVIKFKELIETQKKQKETGLYEEAGSISGRSKHFEDQSLDAIDAIDDHLQKVIENPKLYSKKTRTSLRRAKLVSSGQTPEVKEAEKRLVGAQHPRRLKTAKGRESLERAEKNYYTAWGKSIAEGKKEIADDIDWAKAHGRDRDQKLLRDAAEDLRDIHQDPSFAGGVAFKKADDFHADYVQQAKPMIDNFMGKDPDGLSSFKVSDWALDAGGKSREQREAFKSSMEKFLKKHFKDGKELNPGTLKSFEDKFEPIRDSQEIRRLSAETGGKTGKSLMGMMIGGGVAQISSPMIGGMVTAILSPATNPAMYLKSVQSMRNLLSDLSEKEAKTLLGKSYKAVTTAIKSAGTKAAVIEGSSGAQNLYQQQMQGQN